MGPARFEAWVDSKIERVNTAFASKGEIRKATKKAGCDFVKFGNSMKTHTGEGDDDYIIWQNNGPVWQAVFGKWEQAEMMALLRRLEAQSGRPVFQTQAPVTRPDEQEISTNTQHHTEPPNTFPTNFKDTALLKHTIEQCGGDNIRATEDEISCSFRGVDLLFVRDSDGSFVVEIPATILQRTAVDHLKMLDADYRRFVQDQTYRRVVEKAAQNNFSIESDEVLEDGSILVTVTIGR